MCIAVLWVVHADKYIEMSTKKSPRKRDRKEIIMSTPQKIGKFLGDISKCSKSLEDDFNVSQKEFVVETEQNLLALELFLKKLARKVEDATKSVDWVS